MIKVLIDNEEVVFNQQIKITEEILATSSVILDSCYPKSWEIDRDYSSRFYFPKDYSRCEFYNDDELIFAGVVKNTGNISLNPREAKFCKLQILDYKTLLSEGDTLDFVIANKTIREAIQIVTDFVSKYGFVVGNINLKDADDVIGAYSTLNKAAYDVYQYLAGITQSKWFTRRIDDKTIAIDFYDSDSLPKAEDIEYSTEYFEKNSIIDMHYSRSANDYRNKQVVTSSKVYSNVQSVELKISNGYNNEFNVEQPIGSINSIYVNNELKTFATNSEREIGITADFYYSPGESKFTSDDIYSAGTEISIYYIAIVQGREVVYNTSEIQRIKEQLQIDGTISRYEDRNDILYSNQLQSIAKSYIKYKGQSEITLTIETHNNNLFKLGQQVLFKDAPIDDLKTVYMVKKKIYEFYIINDVIEVFYKFELTNTFNSETAINFFDNQRSKASGNIAQGEYITRNIDVENTANIIFSNLEIEEISFDDDNTLESSLEFNLID